MDAGAAQDLSLHIPGLKVASLAWGPEDARPVLALHGWLDNAASFALLGPRLSGCRVVAVDLPGHGLSDHHPPGVPYHFVDWVRVVLELADALGWRRFSLVGHSMGAGIGTLVAGAFPERIDGLVLLDGLGPLTEEAAGSPQRLASGIRALRALASRPRELRSFDSVEAAAQRLQEVAPGMSLDTAMILVRRGLRPVRGGLTWRSDPRMRIPSLWRLTEAQVMAFLARIACPTLLIKATHGWPFDPAMAQRMVSAIPRVWPAELPGSHHVHLDNPKEVASMIEGLLAASPR